MSTPTPSGWLKVTIEIPIPGRFMKTIRTIRLIPDDLLDDTFGNKNRYDQATATIGAAFQTLYEQVIKAMPEKAQPPKQTGRLRGGF